jgi:hypothetical protein
LDLDINQIGGNIPESLGDLQNLLFLQLRANDLEGSIPEELGNIANIERIWLQGNDLTGTIPAELGNLSNLRSLDLFENQLTGNIPPELGNLSNLRSLTLHTNHLTGIIPTELGNLVNLEDLDLGRNQLTGNIPTETGNLSNLELLNLNGNALGGNIPTSLTNLTMLVPIYTNLGYNALFTDDDALQAFLANKDPDWEETQTIAPEDVSATYLSDTSIQVSWTPIAYTPGGGYRVLYSMISGGPYTLFDTTASKSISQIDVTGLNPNTTYYFVIQTQSDPHADNDNTVYSQYSQEVFATTSTSSLSGTVTVSIAGHDELAVTNATISLRGTPYTSSTDGSGNFSFENVPPGTYTMTITSPDLIPVSQEVTIPEGQIIGLGVVQLSVLTEQDLAQAIQDAVESWDVNGNGKIELVDIIYWLQVLGGISRQ